MKLMRNKKVAIFIFLFLSLIIFFFRDSVVLRPVTSFFQSSVTGIRGAIFSSRISDESDLVKQNRELSEKLSGLEIIERENIALRSQFEENSEQPFELMPAKIVGYRGRGVYESFLIDAGDDDGIRTGMAVIVGNTLVGNIHKVSQRISEVQTTLHPEFSTLVKYPKTNARGIIRGFNSYLILDNVLITDSLDQDGIVVTMGEVDNSLVGIPSNLSVGKIDSIEKIETASFQTAQVSPLVD